MTSAGTATCDGCDCETPAQQLEEVILPSGPIFVCPECRLHAEELAENERVDCEGCGDSVVAATLDRTPLPGGTELVLCESCQSSVDAGERPTNEAQGASDSAEQTASSAGSTATTGGSAAADGSAVADGWSTAATGSTTATSESTADAGANATAGSATETGSTADAGAHAGQAITDGATGKPATTENTCDQCGCLFSIELYQVTTVDGRTEEFCPDCKDDGIERGIVRDVDLRRAQAYEALGLSGGASGDQVRQAYLEQVKNVHPDRADGSRSEFMLVQQAYERLRDD